MIIIRKIFIYLLALAPCIIFSQNTGRTDSLNILLNRYESQGRDDSTITNLLEKLYYEYQYKNPAVSIEYIDKAQKIFTRKGDRRSVANCYHLKGVIYFDREMYTLALDNYYKSYGIYLEMDDKPAVAYSLIDIANTYFAQQIYDIPLEYYRRAISIFRKLKDRNGLSVPYNNIALVKRNTGEPDSALYYLNLSLELRRNMQNPFLIAHSYYYIGKIYRMKGEYDKAIGYFNQSLRIKEENRNMSRKDKAIEADLYYEIAITFKVQNQTDSAGKYFLKAIERYDYYKNNLIKCRTYIEAGEMYVNIGNLKESLEFLNKGLAIAIENSFQNDERRCYSLLYKIYVKQGNKDSALKYISKYSLLSDTMTNNELTKKLNEVRVEMQTYSKEKENEILVQKARSLKRITYSVIFILSVITLFAVLYLNSKRRNEKRWRQLLNVTFEGILIYDAGYKIMDCNNKLLKMLGYSMHEIKGKTFPEIITGDKREQTKDALEIERQHDYETEMERKDGTRFFAEILSGETTFRHKLVKTLAIRDITQRKSIEEQLKIYADELKELNTTKDKFFSIIAHDLRNPFIGIINISEKLLFDMNNQKTPDKEYVRLINECSKKTYYLLENLLEWSLTQTGRLRYEPNIIDLYSIAKEEAGLIENLASEKGISIHIKPEGGIFAFADRNHVKTVFRNLISNAVKFTEKGEIKISFCERKDEIEIGVSDTGAGISKQDRGKIFRIDISQRTIGVTGEKGSGLGLILCREFVEKNGGRIWFESEAGKGTRFYFTLPKA